MSVQNGDAVDATITNAAFVSKTANSTVTGAITLSKPSGSGAVVADVQAAINDGISSLNTHMSDTSTHGIAGNILGDSDAQVVTNKDIDGGTASNTRRITLPKDTKTNLDALTRKQGTIVFDTVTNKPYYDDGTSLVEVGSGSGSGAINFIGNADAEDGSTTGWSTYADVAGTRPVDGTGGVANVTWTTTSTNPLNGTSSFLFTKDAVNRQGQGVSSNFDLPLEFRAKALTVKVPYIVESGTFAAGTSSADSDAIIYFYDITNSKLVEPSSFKFLSNSTTVSDAIQATVQFDSNCTSARMIIHCASTSAAAYVLKLDDISVGPTNYQYGTPITDWAKYTPNAAVNQGFGTIVSDDLYWRRIGSNIEVRGSFTTGTTTSSEARLALPNGLITTTDVVQNSISGTYGRSALAAIHGGFILKQNGVSYVLFSHAGTFSNTSIISTNPDAGNNAGGTGERITIMLSIPIQGWSSSVQTSDQTDTRVVNFSGYVATNQALTANVTNLPLTSYKDTHGGWTGSTYIVQVPGDYNISLLLASTSGNTSMSLYKNGVLTRNLTNVSTSEYKGCNLVLPDLKTGDILSIRADGAITIIADSDVASLNIFRISGPSSISANETIACNYTTSAGQSISSGTFSNITFGTKVLDTHGSFSGNTFTALTSGTFQVNAFATFVGLTTASSSILGAIFKNGSNVSEERFTSNSMPFTQLKIGASWIGKLNAGDVIQFRIYQDQGASRVLSLDAYANQIYIIKVGN